MAPAGGAAFLGADAGGGHAWGGIAAALVAVLVLAGGIGFLSQGGGDDQATSGAGDSGSFQRGGGGAVSGDGTGSRAELPQATSRSRSAGMERGNLSEEAAYEGFAADQPAPGSARADETFRASGRYPSSRATSPRSSGTAASAS